MPNITGKQLAFPWSNADMIPLNISRPQTAAWVRSSMQYFHQFLCVLGPPQTRDLVVDNYLWSTTKSYRQLNKSDKTIQHRDWCSSTALATDTQGGWALRAYYACHSRVLQLQTSKQLFWLSRHIRIAINAAATLSSTSMDCLILVVSRWIYGISLLAIRRNVPLSTRKVVIKINLLHFSFYGTLAKSPSKELCAKFAVQSFWIKYAASELVGGHKLPQ